MNSNVYFLDPNEHVAALKQHVGSLTECRKLGFLTKDERGRPTLTGAGIGYLRYAKSAENAGSAAAFAAGYRSANKDIVDYLRKPTDLD